MRIKTGEGKKKERGNDRYIEIKTNDWERIGFNEILEIIEHMFLNEDVIYPRPKFKGSGMFMDEIIKLYATHIDEKNDSLKRYKSQ